MPSTVCGECKRFMQVSKIGIMVFEMADFGIYKIWNADIEECPQCKKTVISRWGNNPLKVHHQEGFEGLVRSLEEGEKLGEIRIFRTV